MQPVFTYSHSTIRNTATSVEVFTLLIISYNLSKEKLIAKANIFLFIRQNDKAESKATTLSTNINALKFC